ncbi:P2X purinoceptor 7-like [Notothenia coriiceps]|uniref:P2X purinoceptor 7-like n=1 Tax=Notothenia coriiceps TaxID=8208 RepID=A0A6I9N9Y8_9TELE|nr:PREDICTED: P2X purinoceptor 7-like [Notothenia coriiceps]
MASNATTSDSDSDHSSSDSVGYLDSVTEVESEPASLSLQGILPYQYDPPARQSNNEAETCEREADSAAGETRVGNTEWCTCQCCESMPTADECVCCREIWQVMEQIESLQPTDQIEDTDEKSRCIISHPGFREGCLSVWTLKIAYLQYKQQHRAVDGPLHQKYRYTAYRQFVRWCWGVLSPKIRVPLPACAVTEIRKTYPEPGGRYQGFQWPNL